MKRTLTIATILSLAAIASDVWVAEATSLGCIFGKSKQNTVNMTTGEPSSTLVAKKLDTGKLGIAAAGIVGIGGIASAVAAGIAYKARRQAQTEAILDEMAHQETQFVEEKITAVEETSLVEETISSPTTEKELTAVR